MSRNLTSTDIINEGNYLSLSFDPKSLTAAQLTGIFLYHNIKLPSPHTKGELVKLFKREITANSLKLQQDRINLKNIEAAGLSRSARGSNGGRWEDNNVFQTASSPQTSSVPNPYPLQSELPVLPRNSHSSNPLPRRADIQRVERSFSRTLSEDGEISRDRAIVAASTIARDSWSRPYETIRKQHRIHVVLQSESAPIGYCDRGSQFNERLAEMQNERSDIEACRRQQAIHEGITCPSSSFLFRPGICTPCPEHASCYLADVVCDDGYILDRHPLSSVPILSKLCDGLPLLGPVAFPPKCIEDPVRMKSIDILQEEIVSVLAVVRGRRICANEIQESSFEGGDAQKWGLEMKSLKDDLKRRATPLMDDDFDALFEEALQQLLEYRHLMKGKDSEGQIFLATVYSDMSWECLVAVFARNTWKKYQNFILSILALVMFAIYGRYRITAKRYENQNVSELVQLALNTLRNQELSHHKDPATTPVPYLSSLQLRDAILEEEHSLAVRTRLWAQVEKVIESNANVRVNMEELPGGDELRVWRWVGAVRNVKRYQIRS